ncbi:MAG: metal ABC transporter ATP-binding protein [Pseudanabaenaceae cyanobacterium]
MTIQIDNLTVRYQNNTALRQVSAQIQRGRLTGLIGPHGAGKSTMMKAMLGLIPAGGTVSYGAEPASQPLVSVLDQVAYVPQRAQIDWTYPATVWDVVMMGRVRRTGWFRRFSGVSRQKAMAALERVALADLADRPIGQLSGGQQQRVFLARSLAQEADIFCFDEPFAGVDRKTEGILFNILRELAAENHVVLVVHHDLGESITNFDDLLLLNGALIASGERQTVLQQENVYQAYGGQVSFWQVA